MARPHKLDIPKVSKNEMALEWISVKSLAMKTKYSPAAIYQWIRQGKIKGRDFLGVVVVPANTQLPPGRGSSEIADSTNHLGGSHSI
jgi:hypothetical protein